MLVTFYKSTYKIVLGYTEQELKIHNFFKFPKELLFLISMKNPREMWHSRAFKIIVLYSYISNLAKNKVLPEKKLLQFSQIAQMNGVISQISQE